MAAARSAGAPLVRPPSNEGPAADITRDLEYQRRHYPRAPIGFVLVDRHSVELAARISADGVLMKRDFLVISTSGLRALPRGSLARRTVTLSGFLRSGGHMLYLLGTNARLEWRLANLSRQRAPLSVNDLRLVRYPRSGETCTRRYRMLYLSYSAGVVPPLHYSNYAFVQLVKTLLRPRDRVLDMCAGPGTIGLSLLKECRPLTLGLAEINPAAVADARRNARRNFRSGRDRILIMRSDVFDGVPKRHVWDMIVANPPHNLSYESRPAHLTSYEFVQAHDPQMKFHRKLLDEASRYLSEGGRICLLENAHPDCISMRQMRRLVDAYPEYRIETCAALPNSQFYAVVVRNHGRS